MHPSTQPAPNPFQPLIVWIEPLEEVGDESEEGGGAWTKLLGQIEIAGIPHHLEGWAVETNDVTGYQTPISVHTNYDDIMPLVEGAGVTVAINGHDYFMVVTPHQL